ncbi:MAG TPA: hypothetical protein VN426_18095 [Syntrophomonadaceae bacterium]|nr:hypothetical protein [Syntrophomonadaceae bacterium]
MLKRIEKVIIHPDNEKEFVDRIWKLVCQINEGQDVKKQEIEDHMQKVTERMNHIIRAVEEGMPYKHMAPEFNKLGEQKDYLEKLLLEQRSPFENVTRQDVVVYQRRQRGRLVKDASPETLKEIMTSYIKEATILGDDKNVIFKLHFGSSDKPGVGDPTLLYHNGVADMINKLHTCTDYIT